MADMETLTRFFMWCTLINGGLLFLWAFFGMFAQDFVYQTQRIWFSIPRETFTIVFYGFLGIFKILFLFFNLVPYIALLILR